MEDFTSQSVATLLVSLRIAPTLAFAPPFTLLRVPATVRLLLAISLAAWLVAGHPQQTWQSGFWAAGIAPSAAAELALGIALALTLQFAFAALLTAGRAIDIQAGFGLAALIDPATRTQMPLVGTLFDYAAAAIFFATGGPADLLAIWQASVAQVPLGAARIDVDAVSLIAGYAAATFVIAFGAGGLVMLVLFVIDMAIAYMSRTLPQMNVLLLGFQVKTLALLALLPLGVALSSALFLRLLRYALQTTGDLL